MRKFQSVVCLVVLWAVIATAVPVPVPTEQYPHHEVLDYQDKYHVYWKFNDTHITFEVHVNTKGYVGFGLSPNGKMYPSDVVVGWVKDGVAYFTDRHTVGHVQPVIDDSQDWELLHAEENNFGTMLKFTRAKVTCDGNDTAIVDDTMRIIFAYHPDDPTDENNLQWHGPTTRGAKSMLILSTSEQYHLPTDVKTKDFTHHQFHIPTKRTTYQCRVFSFDEVKTKHHMIKFEAVIQKGHEPYVHHMNVYRCKNYPRQYLGQNFECYKTWPLNKQPCGHVLAGWAVGSGPFYLPHNVGLPVGENEHEYAYIIEIHYNNPGAVAGLVDNSGLRFTYTSQLRQHDADILTIGMYENQQQVIPPFYNDFLVRASIPANDIEQALNETGLDEVKVFGLWQHAHLLAKGITTRHFRGDVELKPLADDDHYDFDFQETRMLRNEIAIQKGDSMRVECTYDSSKQTNITYGGFSTSEEMCFSFIYYYPRLPLFMSIQLPLYDTIPGHSSLLVKPFQKSAALDEFVSLVEGYNWTDPSVRYQFQQDALNSSVFSFSYWKRDPKFGSTVMKLEEPLIPYSEPSTTCQ